MVSRWANTLAAAAAATVSLVRFARGRISSPLENLVLFFHYTRYRHSYNRRVHTKTRFYCSLITHVRYDKSHCALVEKWNSSKHPRARPRYRPASTFLLYARTYHTYHTGTGLIWKNKKCTLSKPLNTNTIEGVFSFGYANVRVSALRNNGTEFPSQTYYYRHLTSIFNSVTFFRIFLFFFFPV